MIHHRSEFDKRTAKDAKRTKKIAYHSFAYFAFFAVRSFCVPTDNKRLFP